MGRRPERMGRGVQIGRPGIEGNRPLRFKVNSVLVPIPTKSLCQALVASNVLLDSGRKTRQGQRGAQSRSWWGDDCCRRSRWRRRRPRLRPSRCASQGKRTRQSRWRATAPATTYVNQLETKLSKERTFGGMMLLLTITDCTIEIIPEGARLMGSHIPRLIRCQPLKRVAKLLTLLVSSDQGRRRRSRGRIRGAWLLLAPDHHELVHKASIGHDGVDSSKGEVLVFGSKLGKEICVV